MDENEINDIRTIRDFKTISFSEYKKSEVKLEVMKNIYNGKIEPACYWTAELISAGHFMDLWEIILLYLGKHVHLGNPKLPIYINARFQNFKDTLMGGYLGNELALRNNNKIRTLFCELVCVLCYSPKKPSFEQIKIKEDEFEIAQMANKFKAPNINYAVGIFKKF